MNELLKKRFYAFFFDTFIVTLFNKLVYLSFSYFIQITFKFLPMGHMSYLKTNMHYASSVTLILFLWSYFTAAPILLNGKTLGGLIFDLKIVDKNNQAPSEMALFNRANLLMLSYFFQFIPCIPALFRKDRRTLHDLASGTQVVLHKEESVSPSSNNVIYLEENLTSLYEGEYLEDDAA